MSRSQESPGGIRLGSIGGIPVTLAWSWFLIAAFIVFAFGPDVAQLMPQLGAGAYLVALGYAVLLLASVLLHELAHAWCATAYGYGHARIVLTLWGGHTQFTTGDTTPGRSLAVALAGPAANFILAGLGLLIETVAAPGGVTGLLISILILANFLVGLFNVLPGLPLDGGRLVESAVWKITGSQAKGTLAAGWSGVVIAVVIALILIGRPLLLNGAVDPLIAVVTLLVAGFLIMGALASIRGAMLRLRLPRLQAATLAEPASGALAGVMVDELPAPAQHGHILLVDPHGIPTAVVDPSSLAAVPRELHHTTPAASVARHLAPGAWVRSDAAGQPLVEYLSSLPGSEYAVLDANGQVCGLLRRSTVISAITGRSRA
ncbi:site-2 protease family protein [Zhihengliuella flava]|uniref:Zinc metalloprotease n=1 Tax=Zhihengliuella flava TaxID=1285193 RepID=A0A931D9I9_9MICC|nr:Zn-dependent protease [Zhihengliuella flava]